MANFQGEVPSAIRYARWDQISWANRGFAFAHASEAGVLPLREGWKFNAKSSGPKDFANRPELNAIDIEMEGALFDSRISTLKTVYLLSKGPFHMRLKTQSAEYLNFVKNTSTVASPNGTNDVGWSWKQEINMDTRKLNLKVSTQVFDTEWGYLVDQFGSASSGGTSGSGLGTTTMAYDRTKFVRSNILTWSVNGFQIGIFEDAKLEMESSGRKTNRKIPFMQNVDVKGEISFSQTSYVELKAMKDAGISDWTHIIGTAYDETYQFTTGAVGSEFDFSNDDKDRLGKLSISGTIPYNVNEGSPNSLFFTGDTAFEGRLIGTGA